MPADPINRKHLQALGAEGFTLLEIILSLVIAGILVSIAALGIVSAMNSYAIVRENVAVSQKLQLAAARIARELMELTAVYDRDAARPYLVYASATGDRQAIAKVNATVRLYDNPPDPLTDSYLQDNGDILSDRVQAFDLTYFEGSNAWDGGALRDLSAIRFSLNLAREAIAGETVDLTAQVHLRNNGNRGGASGSVATAPPTADQYACFITAAAGGKNGGTFLGLPTALPWILLAAVLCSSLAFFAIVAKRSFCPPSSFAGPAHQGSVLVGLVIAIMMFAALGAAIVPLIGSSQLHRASTARANQAYYLAESGLRFAASQYLHASSETDKFNALDTIHGVPHRFSGNQGQFAVSIQPYYLTVNNDATNTTTLTTRFYGAAGFTFPLAPGRLSIDGVVHSFTSASLVGQQISFELTLPVTVAAGTLVYPAAQAIGAQTLSEGGDLSLAAGSAALFPERNGSFVLNDATYTYRHNDTTANMLREIRRTDGTAFAPFTLAGPNADIRLKKFVRVTSTGTVGSGDTLASRDIVYHVQIPEEKVPVRVTFQETFDNLDKWQASKLGAHEIQEISGHNVLRVTGTTQAGADSPRASLIELDTAAVQFDPNRFDAQVKIGFVETPFPPTYGYDPVPVPTYYSAGLCFRLTANTDTYGLGFQRGSNLAAPPDNIDNGLIPVEDMHAIVLWQATNNGADKQWLAYKRISDLPLAASAQTIQETDWTPVGAYAISDPITDLDDVPDPPCDFQRVKLTFATACNPALSDCSTLNVSIDDGASWLAASGGEVDLTAASGQTIDAIRFRISGGGIGWRLSNLRFVATDFNVNRATLLARFKESASVAFNSGGPDTIEPGDRIIGQTSGASATVYGFPALENGSWADGDAAGTLILENVNGVFETSESLDVPDKASDVAMLTGYDAQSHFIKAYFGTESGCGTPNTDPLDGEKHPNPMDPAELNWPPDEGDPWTVDGDHYQLIQWDALNAGASWVAADHTLVRPANPLTAPGSTLGLYSFGRGSLNIYYDDFGYQSFVDQPVAVSQPVQF